MTVPELQEIDPIDNARGDRVTLRDQAVEIFKGIQKTDWYKKQDDIKRNIIEVAIRLLGASSIKDEEVKKIVEGVALCGLVFWAYTAYKPYSRGEYAPFSHEVELVKRWLDDVRRLKDKIMKRFAELEGHLLAVANSNGDFNGQDWMNYKIKLSWMESDFIEYVQLIKDHIRPKLNKLLNDFEGRDEAAVSGYRKACKTTRSTWVRFFLLGEACGLAGTGVLWKGDFIDNKTSAAVAGIGSFALGGWAICGYIKDVDAGGELNKLDKDLQYYESYIDVIERKVPLSEDDFREILNEFRTSVQAE